MCEFCPFAYCCHECWRDVCLGRQINWDNSYIGLWMRGDRAVCEDCWLEKESIRVRIMNDMTNCGR